MLGAVLTAPAVGSLSSSFQACQRAGFNFIQLDTCAVATPVCLNEIIETSSLEGLAIVAFGCLGNPLQPQSRKFNGVCADDVAVLLDCLPSQNTDGPPWRIVTWSGTLSGHIATPHPGNLSPGARAELRAWIDALLPKLCQKNARLLFKPHPAHVLCSSKIIEEFLSDVDCERVGVVMDPCNFLLPKNFHEREAIVAEAIQTLASFTGLVHIKDARIENFKIAITAPGQGQMGYAGLLRLLKRYCGDVPWMIDGVVGELRMLRSREFVELQAKLAGLH